MAVPTLWRSKRQRYDLLGEKCPACSSALFPPRRICPHCGQDMKTEAGMKRSFAFRMPLPIADSVASRLAGDD